MVSSLDTFASCSTLLLSPKVNLFFLFKTQGTLEISLESYWQQCVNLRQSEHPLLQQRLNFK